MNSSQVPQPEQVEPEKKPYTKPEIVYQAPLEAMAVVCSPVTAKNPGGGGACVNVQFS